MRIKERMYKNIRDTMLLCLCTILVLMNGEAKGILQCKIINNI